MKGRIKGIVRKILILAVVLLLIFKAALPLAEAADLRLHGTPDTLIELARKNPETFFFARNYQRDHDTEFEIDISGDIASDPRDVPRLYQWDKRWGYHIYGDDMMALTGCGPTCLSMAYTGLTGRAGQDPLTVARMAENRGYYVPGVGSSWSLMTDGAASLGLSSRECAPDADAIMSALENGGVIIASMGPGDFTSSGHFIVLADVGRGGRIHVNDPNSRKRSRKLWNADDLASQMSDMWILTVN
ncbi:MAG: C39 family peptidase [Anaerovoracaceae bacterium]|jgi:hypothetical protein